LTGHSSKLAYEVIRNRVIQKIIPNLGRKSNAQRNFSIAMILIGLLSSILFGIYLDGYGIHAPEQYTGVCPPPATIHGQSCTTGQIETVTVSGTTEQKVIQVPAGEVLAKNGTVTTITRTVTLAK
jgi:hypothetical protein